MIERRANVVLVCVGVLAFYVVFQTRKTTEDSANSKVVRDLQSAKSQADIENQGRIERVGILHDSKQHWLESLIESRLRRKEDARHIATLQKDLANPNNQSKSSLETDRLRLKTLEASLGDTDKSIREYELRLQEIEREIAELENVPVFAVNHRQILDTLNSVPDGLRFVPDPAFRIESGDTELYFTAVDFPASLTFHLSRVGDVRNISIAVDLTPFVERRNLNKSADQNQESDQALLMKSIHAVSDLLDPSLQQFRLDSDQAIDHCLWKDGKVEIYDGDVAELGVTRTTVEGKTDVHISFRSQRQKNKVEDQ